MNLMFDLLCKNWFMLEYAKKRASKINISLLRYIGAFYDGVAGNNGYDKNSSSCPKILRAYRDGVRMKKKSLTDTKVGDNIGKESKKPRTDKK